MLDFFLTLGQAAAAAFLLYGGFLVLRSVMPLQREPQARDQEQRDEMLRLKLML